MTQEETLSILSILRASYPAFYSKLTKRDLEGIVSVWTEMFENDDVNLVKFALKELIETHTGFPPDIAALKGKMREILQAASDKPTPEDLWLKLKTAAENGYYGAREEFEKLPPVLKRYVGSPATLKEYSMMSADTFNTVVHGQFLKQIKIIEERQEFAERLPEGVKQYINSLSKPMPTEDRLLTEEEFEKKRNAILDQLEGRK
jgi:hypothetical protein